ncbi:MAG: hypothetical protein AB7N80_06345 [Bdellovibrionales bacterium]
MKNSVKQSLLMFGVLTLVAVGFQNCNDYRYASTVKNDTLKSDNNGGSYEGKPEGKFYRFIPGYTCESAPAAVEFITILKSQITRTKNEPQRCEASVENLNPALVETSIYHGDVVGYLEGIYEFKQVRPATIPNRIIEFWCRDRADQDGVEVVAHHDGAQRLMSVRIYYARLDASGIYQNRTVPDFTVEENPNPQGTKYTLNGVNDFELLVHFDIPDPTQSGRYLARIDSVIEGQFTRRDAICRVGGRFDPRR